MVTQQCFIRSNSWQIINTLMKFGKNVLNKEPNGYIVSNEELVYSVCDEEECLENMILNGFIDCGTNEELFLAIAALRDDSDRFQWFTNGKEWIQCEKEDWIDEISSLCVGGRYNYDKNGELSVDFHKATVKELIKYFAI